MKAQALFIQNYIRIQYTYNCERIRLTTGVKLEDKNHFKNGKLKSTVPDYENKQFIIDRKL